MIDGTWYYNDYTYTAFTGAPAVAEMQSPGSPLGGTTETFGWTDSGAESYYLYVGTSGTGSYDVYNGNQGTNLSKIVHFLPNNGETIYVRLFSMIDGTWYYNDYTYTAFTGAPAVAEMQSPGSPLGGTTETFGWTDSGAESYYLYVGTSGTGSYDVYNGSQGTNTSRTVSNLPSNGETVYVRLLSRIDGAWYYNDYTYTATGL
ncbi:MAG: hypothetical protein GY765_16145 [bacterium]|nr:hypothetical protein [bacterium]